MCDPLLLFALEVVLEMLGVLAPVEDDWEMREDWDGRAGMVRGLLVALMLLLDGI